jgi:hypothetical protein
MTEFEKYLEQLSDDDAAMIPTMAKPPIIATFETNSRPRKVPPAKQVIVLSDTESEPEELKLKRVKLEPIGWKSSLMGSARAKTVIRQQDHIESKINSESHSAGVKSEINSVSHPAETKAEPRDIHPLFAQVKQEALGNARGHAEDPYFKPTPQQVAIGQAICQTFETWPTAVDTSDMGTGVRKQFARWTNSLVENVFGLSCS